MQSRFSSRTWGLDRNVWWAMLLVVLVSTALLGYRIADRLNEKPCAPVSITITSPGTYQENVFGSDDLLVFNAIVPPNTEVEWDFGDNSPNEKGTIRRHKYSREGTYTVTAIVDGHCDNMVKVKIGTSTAIITPQIDENLELGIIRGNLSPAVEIAENYTTTAQANTYEWIIQNNNRFPPQHSSTATFKFLHGGQYVIQLTLDNNPEKRIYKKVTVAELNTSGFDKIELLVPPNLKKKSEEKKEEDKEPQPAEEKKPDPTNNIVENRPPVVPVPQPTVPATHNVKGISNKIFLLKLEGVLTGDLMAADFNQYLCYEGSTTARVNGKDMKFEDFCRNIYGKSKRLKITSVQFTMDDSNCINIIHIRTDKSPWITIPGFNKN